MKADEYDALIADPTGFLLNVWLPRVARDVRAPGAPCTAANNLSFLKGGMAMLSYFNAFPGAIEQLKTECGTVSAISGIFKAPLDIIGDKLRGYMGLTMDLLEQPEKVLEACRALMPHLLHVALTTADPDKNVPVGFWLHRACRFEAGTSTRQLAVWAVIEALWAMAARHVLYRETGRTPQAFAELPDHSILYHVDGDIVRRTSSGAEVLPRHPKRAGLQYAHEWGALQGDQ